MYLYQQNNLDMSGKRNLWKESYIGLNQCFSTLVLGTPQHCTFCMSPFSDTRISGPGVSSNELMSWIRCVWLGRHKMCSVAGRPEPGLRNTGLYESTPPSYCYKHDPRQTGCGGGVATIYSDILNVTQKTGYRFNSKYLCFMLHFQICKINLSYLLLWLLCTDR